MTVEVNEIYSKKLGKCISIKNGVLELLITIDSGPRIVSFGPLGKDNLFMQKYSSSPEDTGHHIWINPKTIKSPFAVAPNPVIYTVFSDRINFHASGYIKDEVDLDIDIIIVPGASDVMITHSIKNISKYKKILALYTNTSLKNGGTLVAPQNNEETNLFANRMLSLWPGSNPADGRFYLGNKFIMLSSTNKYKNNFKFGTNNHKGVIAYILNNTTFIKRYLHNTNARYPDFGTSFCATAKPENLCIQANSPFYRTEHEEIIKHVENWSILKTDFKPNLKNEDEISKHLNLM